MSAETACPEQVVYHVIPTLGSGGAEAVLVDYIRNDHSAKHCVVTLFKTSGSDFFEIGSRHQHHALEFNKNPVASIYRLLKLIRVRNRTVVFLWTYHACSLAPLFSLFRWNILFSIHHSLTDFHNEKMGIRFAIRLTCKLADLKYVRHVLYVSDFSKLTHEAFGFPKSKSFRIDNGLVVGDYKVSSKARESLTGPNRFLIGHVARYHPIKNHRLFLEALRCLLENGYDFTAVMVGNGVDDSNSKLVADVIDLGLDHVVELRGEVSDMHELYSEIDVLVLTSRAESAPRVILESLASGVPVISTDVGDAKAMIGKYGIVTDSHPASVGEGIICQVDQLRNGVFVADCAHEYVVSRYSMDKIIGEYSLLIEKLSNRVSSI